MTGGGAATSMMSARGLSGTKLGVNKLCSISVDHEPINSCDVTRLVEGGVVTCTETDSMTN